MKIGIGVTTTPSRQISEEIIKYKKDSAQFEVFCDNDRKGVSFARNSLLNLLKDNDYIFLFDDDCYPIMSGWEEYFINQAETFGTHYILMPESFKSDLIRVEGEMGIWSGGIGAFSFQTKHALETIGGFNESYDRYGYEDAARQVRANRAGLTNVENGYNTCPIRGLSYIFSMDVYGRNPAPNLSFEEKMDLIALNRAEFEKEVSGDQIFYPYS